MRKDDKHKHFIKEPVYKGGLKALRSFITAHLKYPSQALAKQKTGTVLIRYTINYKGQVVDAKVIKKLGYGCDEEAIRLVKLLKFKIEKTRRVKVQFHKQIQIHFNLPKQESTSSFKYEYASNSKPLKLTKDSVYNYSITIP